MKKIITLILIGILAFSCSNDDNSTTTQLTGSWNWVESSGGISYHTETPESTGKTVNLKITDNSIERYVNGNLDYESDYTIESVNDNGQQLQVITFDNQIIPLLIIDLTKSSLRLREYNVSDGFDITYTRN